MRINIPALLMNFIWLAVLAPVSAWALPYQLEKPVDIITQPVGKTQTSTAIYWRVAPEIQQNRASGIVFYRQESGQALCRLKFSGPSVDISWEEQEILPKMIHAGDLLIVSGIPVPCDVMPVMELFDVDEAKPYEVRTKAGGRTFVDSIQVISMPVGFEEARNNGWLKYDVAAKPVLRLIKAVNVSTDELMVQQLWSDDGSWWIYEETPYRRSWRLR